MLAASSNQSPHTRQLPEGWSAPEAVEDVIIADGVALHRAGLSAIAPTGEEITGASATFANEDASFAPADRAWLELLERASTLDALAQRTLRRMAFDQDRRPLELIPGEVIFPASADESRWRFSRSNGVAIHVTWRDACDHALWELAERDRVLGAWYGRGGLSVIDAPPARVEQNRGTIEWLVIRFPWEPGSFSEGIHVAGVFGFPRTKGTPMVIGFGARSTLDAAIESAQREAWQMLAFLWGETFSADAGSVQPTASFHLERLQWRSTQDHLRLWLMDGQRRERGPRRPHHASASVQFIDLTPAWLAGGFHVSRALCSDARPLIFGDSPYARHLEENQRFHPIP